jgi:hypothetical protein
MRYVKWSLDSTRYISRIHVSGDTETTTTLLPATVTDPDVALTCFRRKEFETFRYSTIHAFLIPSYCRRLIPRYGLPSGVDA